MSSLINGFIIFSLIITLGYLIGLTIYINDYEENKCEMTYMFEYPQYVKISQKIDEKYPKYALYAYSEGRFTEDSRNMFFTGIPVLFIPGNAGSYRQGRSLASVALRKAINSRTRFHFDYFMIDVNHEFSGLNGALLIDQLEYANNSIYRILELYKERQNAPKSVILIGHSVGGILARRLVESLSDSDLIPIVITLATPHRRPSLIFDSFTYDFYRALNASKPSNTTFVSITGGFNDFLVPSFLSTLPRNDSLNVITTNIPRSWLPADHVCIIWCKQTILAIIRATFDCVDPKTSQISTNKQFRMSIFHHHLVHHNGLNPFLRNSYENTNANIRNHGEWIEPMGRQFTINVPPHTNDPYFYMVRLVDQPQHGGAAIVALNLETIDWIFVCGAHIPKNQGRVCEEFTHLSHLTDLFPSNNYKRRSINLNMIELMKRNPDWSHVVLRVLPSDEDVTLHVDVYNPDERNITIDLPHMLSFKSQTIIPETPEKAVFYEFALPGLYHVIQSYQLSVDAIKCTYEMRHATARLIVPWAHQKQHKHFVHEDNKPFNVRLYESKPQWVGNQSAVIQLSLDPNCRYKITIRSSILGISSQMARFYSPLLVVNIAAVVLMTLNAQLKDMGTDRHCSLFFVAIKEGTKPYYILTTVKLLSRFLSSKSGGNFPIPDWLLMTHDGTDFFLLPLLLYICSVGIVWILGIVLAVSLVVCETTVHKLALRFLAKTVSFTVSWSDYVMSALHKLPCFVAGGLIFLTFSTTGGLALCVGMVFYFLRLTQMSQDYIEELVWFYVKKIGGKFKKNTSKKEEKKEQTKNKNEQSNNNNNNIEAPSNDAIFFHATVFCLWCIVTIINIPSVLTWAHNFKYSSALQPDPAFIPGLILSLCALPLWQFEMPKIERKGYCEIGHVVNGLAIASLIYAPISTFRLNYIISGAIVLVIFHQLVAPNRNLRVENNRGRANNWYDMIKAKLE